MKKTTRNYWLDVTMGTLGLLLAVSSFMLWVVFPRGYYAARTLQHVFELIRLVRQKTNDALQYRILITMYDRRNRICERILGQMRAAFSHALYDTIIEVDTKLRESPVVGKPITLYRPNTRGARQYRALAEELMRDGQ